MISQMQKTAANQQEHIAEVKAENVQFSTVNFQNDPNAWNQTPAPYNITNSENWSSMTLHLVNLNTDGVGIVAIAISGTGSDNIQYVNNITVFNGTTNGLPYEYEQNLNQSALGTIGIPGGQSKEIQVNFTDPSFLNSNTFIPTNAQVKIIVMTSLNNFFQQTYKPPIADFRTSIDNENLGPFQRDVLVLDGSGSTSDNTISNWNWTIYSGANTKPAPGNWTDTSDMIANVTHGKTTHFTPMDAGPFLVNLEVTDNVGMTGVSESEVIPADQNYVPIVNPVVQTFCYLNGSGSVTGVFVKLKDIDGNPPLYPPAQTVNFVLGSNPYNSNFVFNPYSNVTDQYGNVWTNVTSGNGTINVIYGTFPAIPVQVKDPAFPC